MCVYACLARTSGFSKSHTNIQRDSKFVFTSDVLFPVILVSIQSPLITPLDDIDDISHTLLTTVLMICYTLLIYSFTLI